MPPPTQNPELPVVGDVGFDSGATDIDGGMDVDIIEAEAAEKDLRDFILLHRVEERSQARAKQQDILSIVQSMGGDGRKYRRGREGLRAPSFQKCTPPRA